MKLLKSLFICVILCAITILLLDYANADKDSVGTLFLEKSSLSVEAYKKPDYEVKLKPSDASEIIIKTETGTTFRNESPVLPGIENTPNDPSISNGPLPSPSDSTINDAIPGSSDRMSGGERSPMPQYLRNPS